MHPNQLQTTGNNIEAGGAESIAKALQSNTYLKTLVINGVVYTFLPINAQQVTDLEMVELRV